MSSHSPDGRRPASRRSSVAGKKRRAADDFFDSDHVKRLNSHRPPSPGKGGDGKRDELGTRNQVRFSESPALSRRWSLHERSHQTGLSPLTRAGTSPAWETNSRPDDYNFRGQASLSGGPLRVHDIYRPQHPSSRPETASREVEHPVSQRRANADGKSRTPPQPDTRPDPRYLPKEPDSEPGSVSRSAVAGSLSGSSTPRVAMTPISSEVTAPSTDTPDSGKNLARMLTDYTSGIISTTQSMSRYELAQRRLHRSRKDDRKWHEKYGDFAALEEMQNKILVGTEKRSSRLEKKVGNVRKSHKQVTAQIASRLVQLTAGNTPSRPSEGQHARAQSETETNPSSTDRMKADMTRLRSDVEKLTLNVNASIQSEIEHGARRQDRLQQELNDCKDRWSDQFDGAKGDFNALRLDLERSLEKKIDKSNLRAYEQNAAELKISISKIRGTMSAHEKVGERVHDLEATVLEMETVKLGPRIHEAEKKARLALEIAERNVSQAKDRDVAIEQKSNDQKARLQALETTNETYGKDIADVKEVLSKDSEDLQTLKKAVNGDGGSNEASVLDRIKTLQQDADKFRAAVNALDSTMDEYESEKTVITNCVDDLSDQLAALQSKQSEASEDIAALLEAKSKASSDITLLQEDVAQINREHEQKDDIVNGDVERLDKILIRQGDLLNKLSERFQVKEVQSRNVSEDPGPNQVLPLQRIHEDIGELHRKVMKHDTTIANILETIGSLKTEIQSAKIVEMIGSLKAEIQSLLTHNPEVQNVLCQHGSKIIDMQNVVSQHDSKLTGIESTVNVLPSQAEPRRSVNQSPRLPNGIGGPKEVNSHVLEALESRLQSFKQEIDGLQLDYQQFKELDYKQFKQSITDTTSNHDTFIVSLQQRFDNLTTDQVIRCLLHRLQSLYPLHPANVQNQFHQLIQRQTLSEQQITNLTGQLATAATKMKQVDVIVGDMESLRHQIAVKATASANSVQRFYEDSVKQIENGKTESIKLIEDGKAESVRLMEKAREQSTTLIATEIGEGTKESIRLIDKAKEDFQQRVNVLYEECQESHSILEQDIHNHLERIQSLQKSRTDHTGSITSINKEIQEIQSSLKAHQALSENSISALRCDLNKTDARITDSWNTFQTELVAQHGILIKLGQDAEVLNSHMRISSTPNRATANDIQSLQEDRDVQLSQGTNFSMSLGQPSSPARPSTETDQTVRQESSDSEPIVTPIGKRGLKRRRGGSGWRGEGSAESSPRAKRGR